MNARTALMLTVCMLAAPFATGCELLRDLRTERTPPAKNVKTPPPAAEPGVIPGGALAGGTVVAAGGTQPATPPMTPPAAPQPQPYPLPQPQPYPLPQPNQFPLPHGSAPQTGFADPHYRAMPTVTGERLNLAPWEVPAERVIDLTRQIESLLAQNAANLNRIKELETLATGREQALAEAMREIDSIAAAAAKEQALLQGEIASLQNRIRQIEEEDIFFLRAVIEALQKMLPEKKP